MNEQLDPNAGPLRPRETRQSGGSEDRWANGDGHSNNASNGHAPSAGVDVWTFIDVIVHRWQWVLAGMLLGAAGFYELGRQYLKPKFTAPVHLLRYETPATSESMKTTPLTAETFAALITSPDLLRRVGEQVNPPIPPERLVKQMKVDPQPDSDLVKVFVAAREPQQAVDLANAFANEAVVYTKELQARQAEEIANQYLKKQVLDMDQDIAALQEQFRALPMSGPVSNKLAQISGDLTALNQNLAASPRPSLLTMKLSDRLQTSLADLSDLTLRYTDANPLVMQKRAQVESLKEQLAASATNSSAGGAYSGYAMTPGVPDPNYDIIQGKLRSLEDARIQMSTRQREAELHAANPPGIVRVFAPATLKTVASNHRQLKIGILSIFGGGLGFLAGLVLTLLVEVVDNRLKTAADVKRVTRLPVLSTLGDLNRMPGSSRAQWGFRAWTMLQGRLSRSQNHGLVCGITSSVEGEGRSTWIGLLAQAASLSGFRVLTIATRPGSMEPSGQLAEDTFREAPELNGMVERAEAEQSAESLTPSLTTNVLATPSQVTEQLTGPDSRPVVHIPLPGWVWNLERRRQWRSALNQWRQIDNLVIFVELPPASVPEAVLLGSNLPNLLWLTDSGTADAGETRSQLETLRDARCNLVGAVLNRERIRSVKRRFPRWIGGLVLAALTGYDASAQTNLPVPIEPIQMAAISGEQISGEQETPTNMSFSVTGTTPRARWQQHLTLGPGDVLTFGLYGEPLLARTEVFIAPDGRVSYLEAQDISAVGLTVDELRAKLDEELGKYRRSPRTIVTPIAFRSKKYFMLGKVVQRGVYTLDRPITVIEALARAHGIENGVLENNTVDLADFSRSFLARGGKRISLDFEKLLQHGDLSQNIQLEPNDYLFFPSANIRQVYVLGELSLPGLVTYRADLTVAAAISARGGFNVKAYKSKVLVVRGSLNHPETFIVNMMDVMTGRAPDFRLQPKDIIYVSERPFYRVEELLDLATSAFIQGAVAAYTGVDGINLVFP